MPFPDSKYPYDQRLVKAAPELLNALHLLVRLETTQGVSEDDFDDAMAAAADAIAKAEGMGE